MVDQSPPERSANMFSSDVSGSAPLPMPCSDTKIGIRLLFKFQWVNYKRVTMMIVEASFRPASVERCMD